MIRVIIVALIVVVYLILSIPVIFVEWLIGKKNPRLKDQRRKADSKGQG